MCYWGLYEAESVRHPTSPAYAEPALAKAVALKGHASKRERLYIKARRRVEDAVPRKLCRAPTFRTNCSFCGSWPRTIRKIPRRAFSWPVASDGKQKEVWRFWSPS